MITDVKDINDFKLNDYLTYLAENLENDAKINSSIDMSSLDYSSLFQRQLRIAVQTQSVENFMFLVIISSIMLATGICTDKNKEYLAAVTLLFTYLSEIEARYSVSDINSKLITNYRKLIDEYKLSKLGLIPNSNLN